MNLSPKLTSVSIRHPRAVSWLVVAAVLVASLGFLRLSVDTDPENMLPADDPVRVRNAVLADQLGVHPTIVVGLFGPVDDPATLAAVDRVHDQLAARPDVVADATFSPASVLERPPLTAADVDAVSARIAEDPVLGGNVLFADEPGAAIFVGLVDKEVATAVADQARDLVAAEPALAGHDVAVAGQPLAEDAFGQQMFLQMAIFAPLAGALVFGLLYAFFRRLRLVLPAMALAMATIIITMGALVGTGNTLHIMSSMIPIFLMPIAILDSVHVLSEFFDRYDGRDREATVEGVIAELGRPIGFTTLTTAAGFASLVLVPIPPVQLFGAFVAFGVFLAWLFTVTLLPAMLVMIDEQRLAVGTSSPADGHGSSPSRGRLLGRIESLVTGHRGPILGAAVALALVATPLLTTATVNDNPVRWFRADHEVRTQTERLGDALPGTFTASLVATESRMGALDTAETQADVAALADHLRTHPQVGAVQTYLDGDYPILRSDDVANIRLQLRNGDNAAMGEVVDWAETYLAERPVDGVQLDWAGEAYLNLTWQQKMVSGMLVGFATTLVAVFVLLVGLFRSLRWAVLAMVPVLWTVAVVYGAMAGLGRDVDMPVAVLSTLVLGIGVDFAIHFVERFRRLLTEAGSPRAALAAFFDEPARALSRNAVVIAVGFLPLALSSLVPYVVVGVLLASIVGLSWLASIVILPALTLGQSDDARAVPNPAWPPPPYPAPAPYPGAESASPVGASST